MFDSSTLAFVGVAFLLTITPGADTMLVVRSVMSSGRRAGLLTTAGINMGLFIHALISGVGLSVILVQSATAYHAVKLIGAAYLLYLGIDSLRAAWRHDAPVDIPGLAASPVRLRRAFAEGTLNNVLNPKVAVFYLAFLPQFIGPGDPVLAKSILLAGLHAAMGITWLCMVTLMIGRLRSVIGSGRVRRWMEGVSGAVLIAFGVRLAFERR